MIIVKNRELLIPNNERYIGTTYDTETENRIFQVPRYSQRGVDLAALTFRLDIQYANESYDTIVLDKEIGEAFVILIWRITSATLQVPGTMYIGLRAVDDEATVKWSSFSAAMYVERHLNTPGNYGGGLSEIEQMEQDHQYMKGVVNELKEHIDYTFESEAWAVGKRDGEDVPETDPTYHNNSKYYSEQAGASATAAANSATAAAGSATAAHDDSEAVAASRAQIAQNASNIAIQTARIDQFTHLAEGSTTGDAELMDARVGADGVTYASAGAATRANDSLLKSQLNDNAQLKIDPERTTFFDGVTNLFNKDDPDITTTGYYNYTNTLVPSNSIRSSGFISVSPGRNYNFNKSSDGYVLWYSKNSNDSFIKYTDFTVDGYITAPDGAYFVRIPFNKQILNSFMVNEGTTLLPYVPYNPQIPLEMTQQVFRKSQELFKKFGLLSIDGSEYYNMFDPDAEGNVYNGYYDRTNTFVSSSTVGMTDYIWINGVMKITTNNASTTFSLWYDENKNFIGYIDPQQAGYYIPLDGAVYCRIPIVLSILGSFYVHCEELRVYDLSKLTGLYQYYQPLNLFNKDSEDNLMNGYYSDGTTFNQSATLGQTELIPVEGGHYYKTNFNNVFALWYNEDESYGGAILYYSDRTAKYMMPINAHYARFIFGIATYTEFTVYETDSSYEPLSSVDAPFTFDVQEVVNARGEFNTLSERLADIESSSEWYGLQGVAFGTSLTYRAQTTGGYLQYLPALSGITFDNQGIGSATILAREDYPSLDILARIKSYASFANKRVCILEGFVNDYYYNYDKLGNWYDTAETSVCGCVRSAINYIYSQNADISLFVVLDHYGKGITASTAKNTNNQTQFEYYEEIGKCVESLGVHIIWENKESEISENTPQYLLDNIHMNDLGARQSARTIWAGMKKWLPNVVSA